MDEITRQIFAAQRVIEDVYTYYAREACPCAFPRFRQLVGFRDEDYGTGPVACFEQQHMVFLATRSDSSIGTRGVFQPIGEWESVADSKKRLLRCTTCGSDWIVEYTQYSINLSREFMILGTISPIRAQQIGLAPEPQVPLVAGIHGPSVCALEKCRAFFRSATENEMYEYLTAKRQGINDFTTFDLNVDTPPDD